MLSNSNRVSPVPLLTAEVIEMDPAYPAAGGPPPLGFEQVEMNTEEGPGGAPGYPPQPGHPGLGKFFVD